MDNVDGLITGHSRIIRACNVVARHGDFVGINTELLCLFLDHFVKIYLRLFRGLRHKCKVSHPDRIIQKFSLIPRCASGVGGNFKRVACQLLIFIQKICPYIETVRIYTVNGIFLKVFTEKRNRPIAEGTLNGHIAYIPPARVIVYPESARAVRKIRFYSFSVKIKPPRRRHISAEIVIADVACFAACEHFVRYHARRIVSKGLCKLLLLHKIAQHGFCRKGVVKLVVARVDGVFLPFLFAEGRASVGICGQGETVGHSRIAVPLFAVCP
ncbi:MAG: hypothetical protein E7491_09155 [Ruminococcaceae bacterium]|nr:hypothetical protein [Oscillospiraceae bacterium]